MFQLKNGFKKLLFKLRSLFHLAKDGDGTLAEPVPYDHEVKHVACAGHQLLRLAEITFLGLGRSFE
jgi:hypothetical protein